MRFVCSICGYVYDEAGNMPWEELPGEWRCPLCGAAKGDFIAEASFHSSPETQEDVYADPDMKPLTARETSALCTNLAKGCEKQYQPEQAEAFRKLASWFAGQDQMPADKSFELLLERINMDLESNYPAANKVSHQKGDRGALRSLTWSEKVTRILKSILTRYAQEGDAMLEKTGVYVCTICGFVYIGNDLPEICPVCKVPNRKFERIGG